jgi:hypothetical protein
MSTTQISIQKQIESVNRMIGDLKTVLSMVKGDASAEPLVITELNQMMAARETLRAVERKDADFLNELNRVGRSIVSGPPKHQESHV